MINFIAWIIIGGLAGWVASMIMKADASMGVLMNIIVGILGALLGGFLVNSLLGADPEIFSVGGFITAVLGAVILIAIARAVTGRRHVVS